MTGVAASDDTFCNEVLVTWNGSPGATSYNVHRNTSTNFSGATFIGSSTTTSYSDTTAISQLQYYYWVSALSPCGTSNATGPDAGRRAGGPATPTNLSASDGEFCDFVRVQWTASPSAQEYEVYRGATSTAGASTLIGTTVSTSFDDTAAAPFDTKWYFVKAKSTCGLSPFSSGTTGFALGIAPPVTGVAATDGTVCGKVTITWNASAGATSYIVDRSLTPNFANSTPIAFVTQNTYMDNTAAGTQTYYYWVRAGTICGQSAPSGPDSGFAATIPPMPTGLVASADDICDRISISWDTSPATAFLVFRSETSNFAQALQVALTNECWFDDTNIAANTDYFYWVAAVSGCGPSPFLGPVSGQATLNCPIASYTTGFEPPTFAGSFPGVTAAGVDGWFNPITAGAAWSTFTPPGVLNFPAGPNTQAQFIAGVREGTATGSRLERTVWTSISSKRVIEYDIATNFIANPPADSLIGFVSLNPNLTSRGFRVLCNWANQSAPGPWTMTFEVYDQLGTLTLINPPQLIGTLNKQTWYHVRTVLDMAENRIERAIVTSPAGAVIADIEPTDWYLAGGANPTLPFAEEIRVAAVGDGPTSPNFGNSVAIDNLSVFDPEYQTGFEAFAGSGRGFALTGQGAWYNDTAGGDLRTHNDGAVLGLSTNPTGGSRFVSALASVSGDASAFRNLQLDPGMLHRVGVDVAVGRGTPGAANEIIGRWILGPFGTTASFRVSPIWDTPSAPNKWSLRFDVADANGTVITGIPATAGIALDRDHWYRVEVLADFVQNRIREFTVIDLTTGSATTEIVTGWYLRGGAAGGLSIPTRFALSALSQGIGGNRISHDNVSVLPEASCYPDCDSSGSLDFFDFLCFQNAFANGEPYADCDNSGTHDFFDFLCFQNQFAFGCP